MNNNYFLPVYLNLEKELLKLADNIQFDDIHSNQLSVYSVKIAELLIRTVVEIEAISKELYFKNGGTDVFTKDGNKRDLYFDTDCLNFLESEWKLSDRIVIVSAPNFYFTKEENKILRPLLKANERGKCDWKKAYQAVKHNRTENLKQANLKNLIRATAALYILNIYYNEDNNIAVSNLVSSKSFISSIFSIKVENFTGIGGGVTSKTGIDFSSSTYIQKYSDRVYEKLINKNFNSSTKVIEDLISSSAFIEYTNAGNQLTGANINQIVMNVGEWYYENKVLGLANFQEQKDFLENDEYYKKILNNNPTLKEEITPINIIDVAKSTGTTAFIWKFISPNMRDFFVDLNNSKYVLIINKGQKIYQIN